MFKVKFPGKRKTIAKISALVLSASMIVSIFPSGAYTKFNPMGTVQAEDMISTYAAYAAKDIALNPGRNESELNFAWYSDGQPTASKVQMAKKSDVVDGVFPVDQAVTFEGQATPAAAANYSNKVIATGLEPNTKYVYRVGDGDDANWSPVYDYATQDPTNYTLMFVGDPQIGSSGNITKDTDGWKKTLDKAVEQFPNISYVMSAGDQVETATSEPQFAAFESPEILRSLPVATTIGNHDTSGKNYNYHFNVPNESTEGVTTAGGDYYYTYGDTLFMVLNSNNKTGATHIKFMEDTVNALPDMKWRIVTFHHDIYGAGPHDVDSDVLGLRRDLVPTFDQLDIDMIFVGHDHSYVRSKLMYNDKVEGSQLKDSQENDVNPTGRTYITANSSSGSKYYDLKNSDTRYIEKALQNKARMFSTINVTPSSITVDTYQLDNATNEMTLVDSYGMLKEPENVKLYTKQDQQKDTTSSIEYYFATNNANAVKKLNTTFKFDNTKISFNDVELVTPDAEVSLEIDRDKLNEGEVSIKAELETPIRSDVYGEYKDVLKLTFDLVDHQKPTKASLQLTKSILTTQNRHSDTTSNIEKNEAEVVVGVEVSSVVLNKNQLHLTAGQTDVLTATVQPVDATNKEVVWTSNNESVATVNGSGRVTAVSKGTANITVTTVDGGIIATSVVTVENSSTPSTPTPSTPTPSAPTPSTPTPSTPTPSTPTPSTPTPSTPTPSTPTPSTPTPSNPATTKSFSDVPAGYWAKNAIDELVSRQIVKGTSNGSFEPKRSITRAEFVTMLVRALELTDKGNVTFKDVKGGDWYAEAIAIAVNAGIIQGSGSDLFNPTANITREEMVTMLMRAYKKVHGKPSVNSGSTFKDQSQISSWASESVKEAAALGLISGSDQGKFQPRGITTRAESAQVVYNLLNK